MPRDQRIAYIIHLYLCLLVQFFLKSFFDSICFLSLIAYQRSWGFKFALVWFYGKTTMVGYLMFNPLYTYL